MPRDRYCLHCRPWLASLFIANLNLVLTSRQTREKLQCLYENLMWNNFRKTAVLEEKKTAADVIKPYRSFNLAINDQDCEPTVQLHKP